MFMLLTAVLAGVAGALLVYVAVDQASDFSVEFSSVDLDSKLEAPSPTSPVSTPTPQSAPTPTPGPTATTQPTPQPTEPEVEDLDYEDGVPGSCLILEERWCSTGVIVSWTHRAYGSEGPIITVMESTLAFELPAETPIFAVLDSTALYHARSAVNPSGLSLQSDDFGVGAVLIMTPDSPLRGGSDVAVQEGELLGFVSEFYAIIGQGEIEPPGDYNLLLRPFAGEELNARLSEAFEDGLDEDEERALSDLVFRDDRWFWGLFGMGLPDNGQPHDCSQVGE